MTETRATTALLLLLLAFWAAPEALAGQAGEVGEIESIVEVSGRKPRPITRTPSGVQLRAGQTGALADALPGARIGAGGILQVQQNRDVRVRMVRPTHRGSLTALPELTDPNGISVFRATPVGRGIRQGVLAVPSAQPRADEILLKVEQGALLVDWTRGRLVVEAAGTRTVVRGTRVAFAVDTIGDNGILFVESGEVEFPDHPGMRAPVGSLIQFRRGLPPALLPPGAVVPGEVSEAFRYHNQVVWNRLRRPLIRDRRFLFALGAVAVATAGYVAFGGSGDPTRDGTVTIPIPLPTP
jgi:hypothetical protein